MGDVPLNPLTFDEAVAYVGGPGRFAVKLGLTRMQALMKVLGHPERGKRGALVAGTNGKGSTCAVLASILAADGHKVGTMPSPHLWSYTERVQVDGVPITEAEFAAAVEAIMPAVEQVTEAHGRPTEFETLAAVALDWFRERGDRLVIEVGMGGRLDSTNVLDLGVAIVSNVALDHQQWLGTTVEDIAREKAAVIKPGDLAITGAEGAALRVVEERCATAGVELWRLGQELEVHWRWRGWEGSRVEVKGPGFHHRGLDLHLVGSFQPGNAALAVAAAHALGASEAAIAEGVANAHWPGRLEVVAEAPRVIVDGGHNPAALDQVVPDVLRLVGRAPLALVVATMNDKDLPAMIVRLRRLHPTRAIFTRASSAGQRAANPRELARLWGRGAEVRDDAMEALEVAREAAGPEGAVLACGSLYLVGQLRHALRA